MSIEFITAAVALSWLLIATVLVAYWLGLHLKRWMHKGKKPKGEGTPMSKHDRRRHVKQEFSDAVVEAVEKLVYEDRITRSEADKIYRLLAERAGLPDLVRPKNTPTIFQVANLKDRINLRRAMKIYSPVKLPGDPGPSKNGRVDQAAELARHKKLLEAAEQDAKTVERLLGRLTKKERLRRLQDLNPTAMTQEK